jgi:hypothetical protein
LGNGRVGAKSEQHAGQRKEQHKAIQAWDGFKGQHVAARRPITAKYQGKERKGDVQNI